MTALLLSLGTFGFCLASGLLPFLNAEAYLLSVSALAPAELALPLVVAAALGQMSAKVTMYGVGRGALHLPGERLRSLMARAQVWCGTTGRARGPLVLISAVTGVPPFYLMAVTCGALRVRFGSFLALGLSGRLLRFGAVVLLPQLVRRWAS